MSAANTAGRRKKVGNYSDIGNVGRKTGYAWKDTGVRDENGLEPIEGLFTSPEKGPRRSTRSNSKMGSEEGSSSEDMEVPESSAPDPTEILTERRTARNKKLSVPPPGRSPIKTNIGATPKRGSSIGAAATSPLPSHTPVQSSPRRTPNRLLDFSMSETRQSAEQSPIRANSRLSKPITKPRRDIYSVSRSPERSRNPEEEREGNSLANGINHDSIGDSMIEDDVPRMDEEMDTTVNGAADAEALPDVGNSTIEPGIDDSVTTSVTANTASTKRRRTRSEAFTAQGSNDSQQPSNKRRVTRRSRDQQGIQQLDDVPADEPAHDITEQGEPDTSAVEPVQGIDGQDTTQDLQKTVAKKGTGRRGRPKKEETTANTAKKVTPANNSAGLISTAAHGRQLVRHTTPSQDDRAVSTRSGRTSVKPLDFWKGEKFVFRKGERLPTIDEIVRVRDLTPVKRAVNRTSASGKQRRKKRKYTVFEDEEDENDGVEQWEIEDAVIVGPARIWDPIALKTTDEEMDQQIAFAASGVEFRDTPDPKFRFSKTLTLAWFGCGMVELAPGGVKRPKNSRKMQLVFFVHYGKVLVDVAGTQFTITKGGMWQVPRGNLYSIHNESDHEAKIFFAQGCEIPAEADVSQITNLE